MKVLACLACDDFRTEAGGKATIVGFAGALPFVSYKVKQLGVPIPQLVFVFLMEPGVQCGHVHFEHYAPSGAMMFKSPKYPWPRLPDRCPIHLPFRIVNFKPTEFGAHRIGVALDDGRSSEHKFQIQPFLPPVAPPKFGLLN